MDDNSLHRYRKQIDHLDERLVRLLAKRFEITRRIGVYKVETGLPRVDPEREAEQVAKIARVAREEGIDPTLPVRVLRLIVEAVVADYPRRRGARTERTDEEEFHR